MNLQCVANVGEERFVIPPVTTKPKNYNTWSCKMDDTFVFDVSRQFTFNLGVYGTHPHQPRRNTAATVASRVSLASRHLGRSVNNDSNPSLMSNSSTRTSAKIKAGFRKIFRNKGDAANDAAYTGTPPGSARNSMMGMPGSSTSVGEEARCMVDNDVVHTEEATDETGRPIEVQKHTAISGAISELDAAHGASSNSLHSGMADGVPSHLHHPALARLSTYLPRSRAGTTTSAHEINYNGPRLRAFSNASTVSSTPQPLGELYLDFKVDRREKRRATFTLPVVNQDQVAMRGGAHVEMSVVLEYGIIVHETFEERVARQQREQQREEADRQHEARQLAEQQWAAVDEQDRLPRLRGYLSVFTRSGRLSTWKRYWAVLSCARVLLYESDADEKRGAQPAAKISLVHLHDAGVPQSDLVNIGPTGIELRLSPLAMTDRHRRKSAFPRTSDAMARKMRHDARAAADHMPDLRSLRISPRRSDDDFDRTLTSAPEGFDSAAGTTKETEEEDEDDATLYRFSDWQCRVYLLLETLGDRDEWLRELTQVTVPSAEFARMRARQRRLWRRAQFESAAESLRQSGKALQVVAAQALEKMSSAHNAQAKKVFAASVGQRVVSTSAVGAPEDLSGDTLTTSNAAVFGVPQVKKAAVAMAFGKPATFSLSIAPTTTVNISGHASQLPAKKKLRARRKSNSMANLRQSFDTNATLAASSDDENVAPASLSIYSAAARKPNYTAARRDSSGSTTMVDVVDTAAERRPGTVSRRFLFVWNVNDI
ncbi:hypothetical protein IW150_004836 [Coemansia sp. RSA 2607]|nr:hypothetical protein IW150_004836 [Coemansia sp. RSA 2607]